MCVHRVSGGRGALTEAEVSTVTRDGSAKGAQTLISGPFGISTYLGPPEANQLGLCR